MHPTRRLRNNFLAAKIRKLHGGGSPVGWGKERTPTSTTLTPTITDRISLTRTIRRNDTAPSISMRTRVRPIGGATDVSVFHWVVMNVIDVAGQIISSRIRCCQYRRCQMPRAPLDCRLFEIRSFLGKPRENPALMSAQRVASGSTTMATISQGCVIFT